MSVKSANILVGVLIAVFVIVFLIVVNNNGFTVKFESNGGTDVKAATLMYGDKVETETPTREGYVFTGWYLDRDCTVKWDAADTVNNSIRHPVPAKASPGACRFIMINFGLAVYENKNPIGTSQGTSLKCCFLCPLICRIDCYK